MNKSQLKYYRMFLAVQNTLDNNTSVWNGNPKFTETKNLLDTEMEGIENLAEATSKSTKGDTRDKNQIRKAIENKLLALGGTIAAHAALTNSESLKSELITTRSGLESSKETDLITYSEILAKQATDMQDLLTTEYGVTSSEIEDLTTVVAEYKPLIGTAKPKQAAINAAKNTLDEHVNQANSLLKNVIDKLLLRYQFTNPTFYNEYQQSRTIVD